MGKQDFEKAALEMKLQTVITNLKKEATFQEGHWSSAQYFEEDLKNKGITPPIEIYHKYKMPNGCTEKEYKDYIMWLAALREFRYDRIFNIPEYVNWWTFGTDVSDKEKQDYQNKLIDTVNDLNDDEKTRLFNLLLQEKKLEPQETLNQVDMVKTLNPELKYVKVDIGKEFDFLIGVTSGFHPDDIKYYLSITDNGIMEDELLRKKLGMTTYALYIEPKRMQKIIDRVEEYKKQNMLLNNNVKN